MNRRIAVLLSVVLFVPAGVSAQSVWLRQEGTGVALEYRRIMDDEVEIDFLSGAYFLTGRYEMRSGLQAIVEVPWARVESTEEPLFPDDENETESSLGNVFLGVVQPAAGGEAGFDLGLRLPTADDDDLSSANFLGARSSFMDRLAGFSPEVLSAVAGVRASFVPAEQSELRARLGIVYIHWTGEGDIDDDAFARLTGQAFWTAGALRFGGGLETLFAMTGGGDDIGERTLVEGVIRADYDFGPATAGADLHLPIDDDFKDFFDYMFGLSIEVDLN